MQNDLMQAKAIITVLQLQQGTQQRERKVGGVLESKALGNLKTVSSDRGTFRMWNEKFVNAMSQVIPGFREAFKRIQRIVEDNDVEKLNRTIWDVNFTEET